MTRLTVKYECKAYKIFEGKGEYKDGDVIAIAYESRNHGTLHRRYTLSSAVKYAIDNCRCPFDMVEKTKERGEDLHWAIPKESMLTSHERPQEIAFMQKHGDKIKFHGKTFEIKSTANHNISLKLESNYYTAFRQVV
jgi:hypothetical protein